MHFPDTRHGDSVVAKLHGSVLAIKNRPPTREGSAVQWWGISPSHSTPESFMGTFGSRPRVTARVMSAVRFS